jgi:hypothetical protein
MTGTVIVMMGRERYEGENTVSLWEQIVLARFINQIENYHMKSHSRGLAWLRW